MHPPDSTEEEEVRGNSLLYHLEVNADEQLVTLEVTMKSVTLRAELSLYLLTLYKEYLSHR